MISVTVQDGQTIIDIAIQELGDPGRIFEIAALNNMSITDLLVVGSQITVPDYDQTKKEIVKIFSNQSNKPASGYFRNGANDPVIKEGIDYWAIRNDFIVS